MSDEQITPEGLSVLNPPPPSANGKSHKTRKPTRKPVENNYALGDDDDDDTDDADIVGPSRPSLSLGRSTPLSTGQSRVVAQQNAHELEEYLHNLDFSAGRYTISVFRIEPELDPETNKPIKGYLEKFTRPISLDEIAKKHGGGKYRAMVQGPRSPNDTNASTILSNKHFDIAGDPIVQRRGATPAAGALPTGVENLLKASMENADKQIERVSDENRELQKMFLAAMSKNDNGLEKALLAMNNPQQQQQLLLEERKLAEQRLAQEREMQERRLAAEREERRREQEAAERRHTETLTQMRMENERIREEARLRAQESQRQYELQLKMLEKQDQEKSAAQIKMAESMNAMQNQQLMQMQQWQAMQLEQANSQRALERDMMMKQIDSLQKKSSPIEDLLKTKQVLDMLKGDDEDGETLVERILDKVTENGPGMLAAIGLMRGGATANPGNSPAQRVLPGSVAVVEMDEDEQPRRMRRRMKRPQTTSVAKTTDAVVEAEAAPTEVENDYKEFRYPSAEDDIEAVLEMLVRDIDLAIQREYEPKRILSEVVMRFPKEVADLVKAAPADQVVALLEQRAPTSWHINMPRGQRLVREMHSLMMMLS